MTRRGLVEAAAALAAAGACAAAGGGLRGLAGEKALGAEGLGGEAAGAEGPGTRAVPSQAASAGRPLSQSAADGPGDVGDELERLRLVQATDLHFLSPRLTDHGAYFEAVINASDAKCMEYSEEMADAFVEQMLRERPDAVLMTGDLTYNGAVQSHEDLAEKLSALLDAGIPVLVLPGNHDVDCPQAARFTGGAFERVPSATAEDFRRVWARFGYEGALSCDESSLSYMAELGEGGRLRALMLDCNAVEEPGAVPEATLAWARGQLDAAREAGARVVACSHQNVLQHAFVAYGYQMANADEVLALYRDEGVLVNLGGHIHAQHYAWAGEGEGGSGEASGAAGGSGEASGAAGGSQAAGAAGSPAAGSSTGDAGASGAVGPLTFASAAADPGGAPFVDVATSALSVSPNQLAQIDVRLFERDAAGGSDAQDGQTGSPADSAATEGSSSADAGSPAARAAGEPGTLAASRPAGAGGLAGSGSPLAGSGTPLPAMSVSYQTRALDVAGWAERQGSENPDLLGFPAYAREFFRSSTLTAFREGAEGFDNADELLEYMDEVNYGFFCGRLDLVESQPDLDRQWASVSALTGFYLDYVFRIDPVRDENLFSVEG